MTYDDLRSANAHALRDERLRQAELARRARRLREQERRDRRRPERRPRRA
ncbi:hypothetical protein [Nocardiopsis alba]|uniref:Uncharacterized protein n=2 Tax=Nocardiopsis alba TaxID=53437 RepID=A0ABV5DZR0_9ACTN|nr:hypothetical protein [Nocardiopsis alba]AFR09154.1 hypothetical protein B005_0154 [Nocardiopsis alba ATCC BAA-2165]